MVRVGLVLSGGGARGFAEIGALKVLKKNNIKIGCVSGSSIGALIGACYAHNQDPEKIEELLLKVKDKWDVYDYSFSIKGLIKGQKVENYIREYFTTDLKKELKFEDLKIPLSVNATDIINQEEIIFNHGQLLPAVMASISYPGFFTARKIEGKVCVDGAILNPLPFDLLKNVDYLIMIDVSEQNIKVNENSNFKDILYQSTLAMQRQIVKKSLELCKVPYTIIKPEVEHHGVLEFNNLTKLTKLGEEEAEKQINKIKRDLSMMERESED